MTWVWVSIGSNIERERHVRAALEALRETFGELVVSPVYETPAEGFAGAPFYNLVAGFGTELPPGEVQALLRAIEERNGRRRDAGKFSDRTLDIDILTYGERTGEVEGLRLPRDEITRYAFVLRPLADVAGEERHPLLGASYASLWAQFDPDDRLEMREVDLGPDGGAEGRAS